MSVIVDSPSLPLRRPLTLVLTRLLAAVLAVLAVLAGVSWLASGGALAPEVVWLLAAFVSAPVVGGLAWSVVAQWGDRVELRADRLVRWQRGVSEVFLLAEVARFDARLSGVRAGLDLDTPVGLRVVMADERVLAIGGVPLRRARPLLQLVGGVLLDRWYAALGRGGAVTCVDASPFPWLAAGLAGLVAATTGYLLLHESDRAALTAIRVTLLLASTGAVTLRAVQTWWAARRTGGVEMSLAGIVPLREVAKSAGASPGAPYRAASRPGQAWTPWSAVTDVYVDGFGLWVHCANRSEPLALSGRAENFFVVNEFIQVMRTARLQKGPAKG